jgi:beta-xylosidase
MSLCIPIMKSADLTNWNIINYAFDILDKADALNPENGESSFEKSPQVSCIRYHNSTFYVSSFPHTINKTYLFSTKNIGRGP